MFYHIKANKNRESLIISSRATCSPPTGRCPGLLKLDRMNTKTIKSTYLESHIYQKSYSNQTGTKWIWINEAS
jgi:hypothetical protein